MPRAPVVRQRRGGAAKGEFRPPLGRERRLPFGEVGTESRRLSQRAIGRRLLVHARGYGVHGALAASDRGLTELRHPAGIAEHGLLQCSLDPPVDEADRQRLVGLDPARGEQKILGARGAHEFDQPARLGMAVDQAEFRRGDGEVRVRSAEPEIAGEREAQPRADGHAANDCDGRAIELHQRLEAVLHRVAKVSRRRRVGVDVAEFGNVGAGAEMRPLALDERH